MVLDSTTEEQSIEIRTGIAALHDRPRHPVATREICKVHRCMLNSYRLEVKPKAIRLFQNLNCLPDSPDPSENTKQLNPDIFSSAIA